MSFISGADRRIIHARVKELMEIANEKYGLELTRPIRTPMINFNQSGTAGGKCTYASGVISFNRDLWNENKEVMLEQTVGHEVAHHVSFSVYGREGKGHDDRWAEVMGLFNLPPEVYHKMPVGHIIEKTRRPLFGWRCDGGHQFNFKGKDNAYLLRLNQMNKTQGCPHCGKPLRRI